jgi:hypothetical protein
MFSFVLLTGNQGLAAAIAQSSATSSGMSFCVTDPAYLIVQ